jgi:hypothetical protein
MIPETRGVPLLLPFSLATTLRRGLRDGKVESEKSEKARRRRATVSITVLSVLLLLLMTLPLASALTPAQERGGRGRYPAGWTVLTSNSR